ncbi:MAG TPA: DUF1499 domain-containing protein [Candidatus Binatia bacterium]|nr:DUF1499 domain-containing protein [Candidatus Binatia bacterium]
MRNVLGLVAALAMVVGPGLAALRLVPGLTGFALFALGGLLAVLVGLASFVQALRGRGLEPGGAAAVLAAIVFATLAVQGRGAPRINDFTTDPADPPAFERAATLPANAARDLAYPPSFAAIQRACCADLAPVALATPPDRAFERALAVARGMGWEVTEAAPAAGRIEAVATTRLFGFHDDVAIRVRPGTAGGSVVDVRSKSRDGRGDLGTNAARIRAFTAALRAADGARP